MNKKGFAGTILLLFFSVIFLETFSTQNENNNNFEKTKNILIEAEKQNFERTIIEENTDKIIRITMQSELKKTNNPKEIKEKINQKLAEFFEDKNMINFQLLDNSTKVLVIDSEKGISFGEYSFTKEIKQKIKGKQFETDFLFPKGYYQKILVIK